MRAAIIAAVNFRVPNGMVAPVNTSLPAIDNTSPRQGDTLTGSDGTWTGSPTFARQWYLGAVAIIGENNSTYVVQLSDVGNTITYQVLGTNAGGSGLATSDPTNAVIPLAPVNTVAPFLVGNVANPIPTDILTLYLGSWDNNPTSYAYLWSYEDGSAPVGVANTDSYQVQIGDAGHALKCRVTAINAGGSTPIFTDTSGTVVI